MSTQNELVKEGNSTLDVAALVLSGGALVGALLGALALFEVFAVTDTVAGLSVARWFGVLLAALGLGTLGVGAASRSGLVRSEPDRTAGPVAGTVFGLVGFVAGGLVASQTLGLGTLWPVAAVLVAAATVVATVYPRGDVGATLPSGLLALLAGTVVAGGVVVPGWSWTPIEGSFTLNADIAIPLLAIAVGFLIAWMASRAYGGFGTHGKQSGAYLLVSASAAGMLLLLVLLVSYIVVRGWAPMTEGVKWGLFWANWTYFYVPPIDRYVIIDGPVLWFHWPFVMNGYALLNDVNGIMPAVVGTVWLVLGAVLFAVPLGVGAAVFLTEYAGQSRFTALVEVSTNGLWSTPSIVYGLFGWAFLVPRLGNNQSILAGQLVLGFMLLPLVIITSREALMSVPDAYRDASAALGVGQWETIKSVVLPAAMPGVTTGVILGVGRIAGETAPILLVAAGAPFPSDAPNVLSSFQLSTAPPFVTNDALLQATSALPYQLYAVITAGVNENAGLAWGTALVLLLVVLSFYAIGIASRIYFRKRLEA
ncbi:phosphate ABC transporter permease PstA [Halarchaeum sp. CBA1220]|uniref:phosphate ABC transporter permease PstA n=1 Tax=Halarchaeum sp. CBA1220 TaxID=1853682 RepID=UPI000F3A95BB|nr:phosphate ABC transporter permease PstA [Halarchaeum sp. CBA1220]QLC33851.1 phosphate ABC transporter permease PstA [Halarchaeum sp. CBA1220]